MESKNTPSLRYAWFVVAILTLANVSSFVDRQILSLLVGSIKRDLHLSDFEISLLMGLSFALFYTLFGIIIGWYADRYSRRNIIIGGIAIWSLMTALCAGVRNYGQFFLARMGVGVGEATLSPSAYSMISDYFPKSRLGIALSVYSMGIFLGSGLALLIVSRIIPALPQEGMVHVPIFGDIFPWQLLFFYVGLPGLVIALILFTIKEPARKNLLQQADGQIVKPSLTESLKLVFAHPRAYLGICFGAAFAAMVSYGMNSWIPTYFNRNFGWSMPQAGLNYGLVLVSASLLGVLWGGWYSDFLVKRGITNGRVRVGIITTAGILLSFFVPLLPNANWVLLGLFLPNFFLAGNIGASASAVQELMPNQVKVMAGAIFLFILNMIGMGIGPSLVAYFTDFVFHNEQAIPWSLLWLYVFGGGLGLLGFVLSSTPFRTAIQQIAEKTTQSNG
ncbi:MAG TPA: MFS transporter [Haliscomenobacter sp.]|uniref:spinster family MFS transporter n=1 Tax=Haliscomenobacter sp. TaxID=2717303 RepID=UPI002C08A168|nr:MFS transporter [Haliscomenobacter sp.]HOY20042.1 MFS transporter [Haliscomenobacter sp.]